jgi:MFS family permease
MSAAPETGSAESTEPTSVWRQHGFPVLLGAVSFSQLGTAVSAVAIPLLAVNLLGATAFEVGLLTTMETIGFLLIGLPVGALVDRVRRRPVLVAADVARILVMGSIPAAWFAGVLSMPWLYAAAFLVGVCTVFFDTAYVAYMPSVVGARHMTAGFAAVDVSFKGARVVGPLLGGALVRLFTAPVAVLVDALTYLVSAVCLGAVRTDEPAPAEAGRTSLVADIREGIALVLRDPVLRLLMLGGGLGGFFEAAVAAIQPFYLLRVLSVDAVGYGIVIAATTVGGMLGPLVAPRLIRRYGVGRVLCLPLAVAPFGLLMAAGSGIAGATLFGVGLAVVMFGSAVFNIAQIGLRNSVVGDEVRGRMNGTIRFVFWGALPIGAFLGGVLAAGVGSRAALVVCVVGLFAAYLPMLRATLRRRTETLA